jgi:hypothetical protein
VVRAGWYGKAPHRRQRWLCRPANGDSPHRFTPALTRQTHKARGAERLLLGVLDGHRAWEGQAGARTYLFSAREVGDALARVATRSSYRATAQAARVHADRVKSARRR